MKHRTRLTEDQIARLEQLHADPDAWLGYWCSDQWGRSANGGDTDERWHAYPGAVHEINEGLRLLMCPEKGGGGLHATRHPHRWRGCRVWMVALLGERVGGEIKCAARKREIICEIRPGDLLTPQIAVRLGVNLSYLRGEDLRGADLWRADLRGADLRFTNLQSADLQRADLWGTDLRNSNLQGADMWDADLRRTNLRCANLRDVHLWGADLREANLRGAELQGADLRKADLRGAKLPDNYEDVAIT